MAQNLTHSLPNEDEIGLIEIFKILIEAKKLIISTILIFTIASIIYSLSLKPSFKSSTQLEIGYVLMKNGEHKLIQSASDLISDLKILLIKKQDEVKHDVSIKSIEEKIIKLETISSSGEKNENLLTEMINYIDERHSNLEKLISEQKNVKLSTDIEMTKTQINRVTSKLSDKYQSEYLNIISNLSEKNKALASLELLAKNSSHRDEIFRLNQRLVILLQDLENSNSTIKSKSQIISDLKTIEIKPNTQLIISLGILIGLFTGILLVFINNFIKSYRER